MTMRHYNNLKSVPATALKTIQFGNLKGKSDINPQWRYEALTNEFGPCGVGWKYEIAETHTQEVENGNSGLLMVFVKVNLYIKEGEEWSAPIPAYGGDMLIVKDKNGIHGNDEAYKMATTDALGTAAKMIGVAADIYRGFADDSKYGREPQTQKPQLVPSAPKQIEKQPLPEVITANDVIKRVAAKAKEKGWTPKDVTKLISENFNVKSSADLNLEQANQLYKMVGEI